MQQAPAHTVRSYDEELHRLRALVSRMGGLAEAQITGAINALATRNVDASISVVGVDEQIDALQNDVEQAVTTIIALRSPMADDLRDIISALKIASLLERIGDYAKNIAKRTSVLAYGAPIEPTVIIPEMSAVVARMVKDALDAYVERDPELAELVCARDRNVDDFYNSLFRTLLTYMMENPQHITLSTHLLFIAKNLERIGDHATNIAEVVYHAATGVSLSERLKTDQTPYMGDPATGDDAAR